MYGKKKIPKFNSSTAVPAETLRGKVHRIPVLHYIAANSALPQLQEAPATITPLCPAGSEMPSHSLINRILSLLVLLACAGATCAASRGGGLQAKYLDTTRQLLSSQLAASPPPYYSGGASLVRRSLQAPAYYPPTLQRRALAGLSDIDEQR